MVLQHPHFQNRAQGTTTSQFSNESQFHSVSTTPTQLGTLASNSQQSISRQQQKLSQPILSSIRTYSSKSGSSKNNRGANFSMESHKLSSYKLSNGRVAPPSQENKTTRISSTASDDVDPNSLSSMMSKLAQIKRKQQSRAPPAIGLNNGKSMSSSNLFPQRNPSLESKYNNSKSRQKREQHESSFHSTNTYQSSSSSSSLPTLNQHLLSMIDASSDSQDYGAKHSLLSPDSDQDTSATDHASDHSSVDSSDSELDDSSLYSDSDDEDDSSEEDSEEDTAASSNAHVSLPSSLSLQHLSQKGSLDDVSSYTSVTTVPTTVSSLSDSDDTADVHSIALSGSASMVSESDLDSLPSSLSPAPLSNGAQNFRFPDVTPSPPGTPPKTLPRKKKLTKLKPKKKSVRKKSKKRSSKKRPKTAVSRKSSKVKSSSSLSSSLRPHTVNGNSPIKQLAAKKPKKKRSSQTWYEIKPMYKSQKPTVCFATDCESQEEYAAKFPDRQIVKRSSTSSKKPVLYYSMDKSIDYSVIKSAFKGAGFKRIKPHTSSWSVRWGKSIKHYEYEQLKPFQRVSHFPGSWNLGNKLKLHYNLMKMKKLHPKDYKFFPSSYVLPEDYDQVIKEYEAFEKNSASNKNDDLYFILKPFNSSCGRGIRVVRSADDIPRNERCLCQQYIHNPLLINKRKFDLRLYIVVSSFNPLRAYRFNDGLARFATEDYNLDSLGSYSHLTNYSVNKHNTNFHAGDDDDSSSKWSVVGLRKYFADQKIDDTDLWQRIDDLVVKTLISVDFEVNSMRKMHCKYKDPAFELLGFDVLIDENLKPWIVEINLGSSLSLSSPLDRRIKTELINQMFHMIGFQSVDRKKMKKYKNSSDPYQITHGGYEKQEKKKKQKYARDASRNQRIQKLKSKSTFKKLLPEERKVIEACQEENSRRGDFHRIHPTQQSLKRYGHLFREERYRNFVVGKFLQLPEDEQERLLGR